MDSGHDAEGCTDGAVGRDVEVVRLLRAAGGLAGPTAEFEARGLAAIRDCVAAELSDPEQLLPRQCRPAATPAGIPI